MEMQWQKKSAKRCDITFMLIYFLFSFFSAASADALHAGFLMREQRDGIG